MLAINTAFMQANLALKTPDGREFFVDLDANTKHSENVLKFIDELCQKAKIDVLDVGEIAVVVGPGSFTGLRIGVAIAKALASAKKDIRLVAISSLELMAYTHIKQNKPKEKFVCAINALSDLFFVAYFDKNGIKLKEEKMIERKKFDQIAEKKVVISNDMPFQIDNDERYIQIQISGYELLEFAEKKAQQEMFENLNDFNPVYLRLSQAEDQLLKKNKKSCKNS